MKQKRVEVGFSSRLPKDPSAARVINTAPRGGCGIHSRPEPYSGPPVLEFPSSDGKRFEATYVERSPTGAAGGSFRIEEVNAKTGGRRVLGYHRSYPDLNVCRRLARNIK